MTGRGPGLELDGLEPVIEVVHDLATAFAAAGHRLYLVGGVVRDLLLGSFAAADDIDLTTDARPAEIKRLVGPLASVVWTQGERFGTIGAAIGSRNVELTTHRAEVYDETSRKPVVVFGQSIEEDLSRRDFTINAIAVSVPERIVLDPFGGRADLERRVLATPLSPEVSFADDPLRMMRAARFLPRFHLEPDDGLVDAATALADRLSIVSVERIHDELERLLATDRPARGIAFLERTGLLAQVVPALASHPPLRAEAAALAARPGSPLVRRAGLFSPLGAGAADAMRRLRYPGADTTATVRLIQAVPAALDEDPSDETVRRVIDRIGLDAIADLADLAANMSRQQGLRWRDDPPFFERYRRLASTEDLTDLDSPLSGGQVMEQLAVDPGPLIGRAVAHLKERRLSEGPMTEAEARREVEEWWRQRRGRPAGDGSARGRIGR